MFICTLFVLLLLGKYPHAFSSFWLFLQGYVQHYSVDLKNGVFFGMALINVPSTLTLIPKFTAFPDILLVKVFE